MRSILLAAAAAVAFAGPASATIQIFSTPGAVQPDENVNFNNVPPPSGMMAFGRTNQTSAGVTFMSDEALVTPASGQARVEGADGGLRELSFMLTDTNFGFREVEFNINGRNNTSTTLFFTDNFGEVFSQTFTLGNGENFFSARAIEDQIITNVRFTTSRDFQDLRQVRIGSFAALDGGGGSPNPIPEPQTWALLLAGFGLVGYTLRRRRTVVAA